MKAMSFDLENPIQPEGELVGSAEVVLIGRRHVEVAVEVVQNQRVILNGRVIMVKVRDGRAQELGDLVG